MPRRSTTSPTSPARTTSTRTCPRATRSASTTSRWPAAGHSSCRCPTGRRGTWRSAKLHLEEDAGKTVHQGGRRLIDFNRCGVPLIEMVTGPDLRSADEAAQYLIRLRQLLRWLGISEADMERGQLRCDANVSIRPAGSTTAQSQDRDQERQLDREPCGRRSRPRSRARSARSTPAGASKPGRWNGTRTSARCARCAPKRPRPTTATSASRTCCRCVLDAAWRATILAGLPELPLARRARFVEQYALPAYDAEILTEERSLSDYFEQTVAARGGSRRPSRTG